MCVCACLCVWLPNGTAERNLPTKKETQVVILGSMKKAFFPKVYKPNLTRKCLTHPN